MTIVTYEEFRQDAARMFEGAVESAYKDLLEKAVAEAVAAEREACAQLCDPYIDSPSDHEAGTAGSIQDAIRARGNK
jgi:predicted Ser/Thr protein kinase